MQLVCQCPTVLTLYNRNHVIQEPISYWGE
jgi:hypothetical protein